MDASTFINRNGVSMFYAASDKDDYFRGSGSHSIGHRKRRPREMPSPMAHNMVSAFDTLGYYDMPDSERCQLPGFCWDVPMGTSEWDRYARYMKTGDVMTIREAYEQKMRDLSDCSVIMSESRGSYMGHEPTIYNPNDIDESLLPVITVFNASARAGIARHTTTVLGMAITEGGRIIGNHCCSNESFIKLDLCVRRHEENQDVFDRYRECHRAGFRVEFVSWLDVPTNKRLQKALGREKQKV